MKAIINQSIHGNQAVTHQYAARTGSQGGCFVFPWNEWHYGSGDPLWNQFQQQWRPFITSWFAKRNPAAVVVNTFLYVQRGGAGALYTYFYWMVQENDEAWDKVTNLSTLHANVPGVVYRKGGDKLIVTIPGFASTYKFSADVNRDLKHAVKSCVNVDGMFRLSVPTHVQFKPQPLGKRWRHWWQQIKISNLKKNGANRNSTKTAILFLME